MTLRAASDDPRMDEVAVIGRTNKRASQLFGIRLPDRLLHTYIIGQTGVGKTTLVQSLVLQDIVAGRGCALIDPHGDLAQRVLARVPRMHRERVTHIDIADPALSLGYNPLVRVSEEKRPLVASGLMSVMEKLWADAWGPRMEHILRNTLLALLDQPKASMPDILRMLSESDFRRTATKRVINPQVRAFWEKEFPGYSERYLADAIAPIQNKVGAFLADPRLRKFVCPEDDGIRIRRIMDEGGVLLVNLSKGRVGEDSSALLGSLIVTAIGLAALSRADIPEPSRRPFYVFVDEFQNVTTLAFAEMLSELRKFGVGFVLAHQYLAQLDPAIRAAVLGNVGTVICFRVGPEDAHLLARQFEPRITPLDLINLPNHHIYLRLMIDGAPSQPFSAVTLPVFVDAAVKPQNK